MQSSFGDPGVWLDSDGDQGTASPAAQKGSQFHYILQSLGQGVSCGRLCWSIPALKG